jgi:cell shape-determining protein MreC
MTSLLATRAARRRGIVFMVLLVTSVLLMAFSSNPAVREFQNGVGFAFRPIQGALDEVARGAASVAAAVAEIDRLRVDNSALRAENDVWAEARPRRSARERSLTGCCGPGGLDYETAATTVIARDRRSSAGRRSTRGPTTGSLGVAVALGGAWPAACRGRAGSARSSS